MTAAREAKPRRPRAATPPATKPSAGLSSTDLLKLRARTPQRRPHGAPPPLAVFAPYRAPAAVLGEQKADLVAMDSGTLTAAWAAPNAPAGINDGWLTNQLLNYYADGLGFFGYPRLAEMASRPEYRMAAETLSKECVREFIEIKASGDRTKADKVKQLQAEFRRLKVREVIRKHIEKDSYFGMSHIMPTIKGQANLAEPLLLTPQGFRKGSLEALQVIEPFFTTPLGYNAITPLQPDFYRPTMWLIQGTQVHPTRLLTGVAREVPDILKPAYNFGGLPLSQVMYPAVNDWLRNRDNAGAWIEQASLVIFKGNLAQAMQGGGIDSLLTRLEAFNLMRNNAGTFAVDKEGEDVQAINRTLAGLTELLTISRENMCMYAGQPRLKMLGLSPTGLSSSGDGEMRVWYDNVLAYQEHFCRPALEAIFMMAQLNIWGAIDPALSFEFVPLWQSSEQENAEIEKIRAETDAQNIQNGAIMSEEARQRIAGDEKSQYHGLDLTKAIPEPDPDLVKDLDGKDGKGPDDER